MNILAWDNGVCQGGPGTRPCAIKRKASEGDVKLPMPTRSQHLMACQELHHPTQIQCPQHPLVAPAFAQTPTIGRPTSTSKSPRFWVAICLPPSRTGWAAPHDTSRTGPACHPLQIWPSASTPPPPEYISDLNFRACPPWPGGRPAAPRGKPRTATARLRQLLLTSNSKSATPKTLNPRFSELVMAPVAHTGKIPGWRQNPIYLTVTTPRQAG